MSRRCVALLSGGLDSKVAIRMMQQQGIDVEAVSFKTVFTCCQDDAAQAARELGVRLTVLSQDDDYLELVKRPQFGYGKGANPCVDCRIYMFEKARRFMEQITADFIISGEVVGQRPMSQKKNQLQTISYHADLDELLLRPLSAKLLPPTKPEREQWVDREQLGAFYGRGRKGIIALAKSMGIDEIPSPSTGCTLTEPQFSRKVFDLLQTEPDSGRWQFEVLKVGRHFRLSDHHKVIVGRRESENTALKYAHALTDATSSALLEPVGFQGPTALLVGEATDSMLYQAAGVLNRYSKIEPAGGQIRLSLRDGEQIINRTDCGMVELVSITDQNIPHRPAIAK